jgi:hypothetical protein
MIGCELVMITERRFPKFFSFEDKVERKSTYRADIGVAMLNRMLAAGKPALVSEKSDRGK